MTRRSLSGRVTPRGTSSSAGPGARGGSQPSAGSRPPAPESGLASLRRRQPMAFWMAVIGALAVIIATFGSLLSAFA